MNLRRRETNKKALVHLELSVPEATINAFTIRRINVTPNPLHALFDRVHRVGVRHMLDVVDAPLTNRISYNERLSYITSNINDTKSNDMSGNSHPNQ
jgi:hypothetical protein